MSNNEHYSWKQVKEITVGEIILHPLYRSDGLLLINRYKKLTSSILKHIRNNFPSELPILVANSEHAFNAFLEEGQDNSHDFLRDLKELFKAHHETLSIPINIDYIPNDDIPENANENPISNSPFWRYLEDLVESKRLKRRANVIKNKLSKITNDNPELLNLLKEMKEYHDALFVHTINSLSLSILIGLALELSDDDLIKLALAALFADIGYLKIDSDKFKDYLNHPELNKDIISTHPKFSVDVIKDIDICRDKAIIYGIIDHHELFNGTGVPAGKKGSEISLFGRILAISKSYDDMTGGYFEEKSLEAMEAQLNIWQDRGEKYDPDIIKIFFAKISVFKVGQRVILNNNQSGEIIGFTNYLEAPLLPIVKLDSGTVINFYLLNSIKNLKFQKEN